jgi:uncharacterized protein (DUF983 family)
MMLTGVLKNRCPVCSKGAVFSGFVAMNRACPSCGVVFEKEPGFFLGASIAAYFLGSFSLVPTMVIGLMVLHFEILPVAVFGVFQILILTPVLYRYSRLIWLYTENRMTQSLEKR